MTIHEPGLDELLARNAERITFTTEMDEVLDAAACSSSASTRRRPRRATPTSRASAP